MANCLKCGVQLPTFSFGEASPYCKECRTQVPSTAKPGIQDLLGAAALQDSPWLNATNGLILINVLVFVAMIATGVSWTSPTSEDLLRWGADFGPKTLAGQYWRLITPSFIHAGIIHLLLNMWCLRYLGRLLERLVGWSTVIGIYLVTGAGATLLSLAWEPMRVSAGASGAIFGLAGALIAIIYRGNLNLVPENKRRLLGYVVRFSAINLLYGLRGNINNMAHLGGLVTGLIAGLFLARSFAIQPEDRKAQRRTVLGLTSVAVVLLFAYVSHAKSYIPDLQQGRSSLQQQDFASAIEHLKKYTAAQPNNADGHAMLGTAYQESRQYDQAAREYERSLQLEPQDPYVQLNLGKVYCQLGAPDRAVPLFKAGLSDSGADADDYYWYAQALKTTGQLADAEKAVRQAIQLDPTDTEAPKLLHEIVELESSSPASKHTASKSHRE